MDSDLSTDEAIQFVFRTILRREATDAERLELLAHLESLGDNRTEQFTALHLIVVSSVYAHSHGIYEIQDDQLIVCLASPGDSRPEEFSTGKDGGLVLIKFKRVKEKAKKKATE